MKRFEKKFLLTIPEAVSLRAKIASFLPPDSYGSYPVFSAYFDTPQGQYFHDKVDGLLFHEKLRIRAYDYGFKDGREVFVENKQKLAAHQSKHRLKTTYRDALLSRQAFAPLSHVCSVYFWRDAFQADGLRVNFDTDICALHPSERWLTQDLKMMRKVRTIGAIFEVKYQSDSFPNVLRSLLTPFQQISVSKYVSSVIHLGIGSI